MVEGGIGGCVGEEVYVAWRGRGGVSVWGAETGWGGEGYRAVKRSLRGLS